MLNLETAISHTSGSEDLHKEIQLLSQPSEREGCETVPVEPAGEFKLSPARTKDCLIKALYEIAEEQNLLSQPCQLSGTKVKKPGELKEKEGALKWLKNGTVLAILQPVKIVELLQTKIQIRDYPQFLSELKIRDFKIDLTNEYYKSLTTIISHDNFCQSSPELLINFQNTELLVETPVISNQKPSKSISHKPKSSKTESRTQYDGEILVSPSNTPRQPTILPSKSQDELEENLSTLCPSSRSVKNHKNRLLVVKGKPLPKKAVIVVSNYPPSKAPKADFGPGTADLATDRPPIPSPAFEASLSPKIPPSSPTMPCLETDGSFPSVPTPSWRTPPLSPPGEVSNCGIQGNLGNFGNSVHYYRVEEDAGQYLGKRKRGDRCFPKHQLQDQLKLQHQQTRQSTLSKMCRKLVTERGCLSTDTPLAFGYTGPSPQMFLKQAEEFRKSGFQRSKLLRLFGEY